MPTKKINVCPINRSTNRQLNKTIKSHDSRIIKNPPVAGSFKSSDYKKAVSAAISKSKQSQQ